MVAKYTNPLIEASWKEYDTLSLGDWRKQWFCDTSGGFVVSHVLKVADDMSRTGIVAEVNGCLSLAAMGKHVLRLPENIPDLIDEIVIDGKPYRELLKFRVGKNTPRGYPDVYFDGMTWDFKATVTGNIDTIRQLIKDGRKADNVIFVGVSAEELKAIKVAMERESGRKRKDDTWMELPNLYCLKHHFLFSFWRK